MSRIVGAASIGLRALFALAVALVAMAPLVVAEPAGAWSDGACPTADGVTVVVDFQELGGGVNVRCAPGSSATGFEALQRAGIDYQTTVRFPGFLCRIAGKPSNDPCVNTSPASAYWSYWLAPRGGTWCYSNWGAGNRNPPEGTVEGWSFSLDKSGSTAPAPSAAPPGSVAGAPTSLPDTDCDRSAAAPPAPPVTAPPATAPAGGSGAVPGGSAAPPVTNGAAPPAGPTGGPSSGPSAPAPDGDAVADTTTVPGAAPEVAGERQEQPVDTAPDERAAGDASSTSSSDETDDAAADAGTVDLSGDRDGGSPVAVILAGGIIAAIVVVSILVRRRAASN